MTDQTSSALDVSQAARTHAFDSYAAALLAPQTHRGDLMALAAFCGEAARIPFLVSEPMLGEIRLQWWRDWLETRAANGARTGNPLADQFAETIARHALDVARLKALLEARADDAYAGCVSGPGAFHAYLDATTGVEFEMAAKILGVDAQDASEKPEVRDFLSTAARAAGCIDVCRRLPWHAARGRWPLPIAELPARLPNAGHSFDLDRDIFAVEAAALRDESQLAVRSDARQAWRQAQALSRRAGTAAVHAVLRTALVEPYLRALESPGLKPLQSSAEILPVTRMWRLWRAHRRQKF